MDEYKCIYCVDTVNANVCIHKASVVVLCTHPPDFTLSACCCSPTVWSLEKVLRPQAMDSVKSCFT